MAGQRHLTGQRHRIEDGMIPSHGTTMRSGRRGLPIAKRDLRFVLSWPSRFALRVE